MENSFVVRNACVCLDEPPVNHIITEARYLNLKSAPRTYEMLQNKPFNNVAPFKSYSTPEFLSYYLEFLTFPEGLSVHFTSLQSQRGGLLFHVRNFAKSASRCSEAIKFSGNTLY